MALDKYKKIINFIQQSLKLSVEKLSIFLDLILAKYNSLSSTRRKANIMLFAALWVVIQSGIPALSNPEDPNVVAGSASISVNGNKLDVNQFSDKAVIDWRTFNIDVNEHTEFIQPNAGSVALNRGHFLRSIPDSWSPVRQW